MTVRNSIVMKREILDVELFQYYIPTSSAHSDNRTGGRGDFIAKFPDFQQYADSRPPPRNIQAGAGGLLRFASSEESL
jgi:hypothetical protein